MQGTLTLHPDSRCDAVARLDVAVVRSKSGGLDLTYTVTGTIEDLALPPMTPPFARGRAVEAHLLRSLRAREGGRGVHGA